MCNEMSKDHFTLKSDGASLIAGRCGNCLRYYFPYKDQCKICMQSVEQCSFSEGRLHSYTVIHTPAPGFDPPYTVGYIDLNEKLRVFGQILSSNVNPMIDSTVKVIHDRTSNKENNNLNFKFEVIDEVIT